MIPTVLPFYFTAIFNTPSTLIGTALSVGTLFISISSFAYRFLRVKFNFVTIKGIAYILFGLGFTVIGLADSYGVIVFGLTLTGISAGIAVPNCISWAVTITPLKSKGLAVGFVSTFLFLGQFLSPIISDLVINQIGTANTFLVLGATMWVVGLIFILIRFFIFIKKYCYKT